MAIWKLCVEDGVVVNIGDLLQRWTNDYFKSTKHRVVNYYMDRNKDIPMPILLIQHL